MIKLASNKKPVYNKVMALGRGLGLMYVLIDTNIFIYREADRVINPNLAKLENVFKKNHINIEIHPNSISELKQYENESRRKTALSKIEAYPQLESPPDYIKDKEFLARVASSNIDQVDKSILYAVYKNAVSFLITEDNGIRTIASLLGIRSSVLSINEALAFFQNLFNEPKLIRPPLLKEGYVYNLDKSDPIFNSVREEYPEFNNWLDKIARQQRRCFLSRKPNEELGAIEIYKEEDEAIETKSNPLPKKLRLKICLLKVDDTGYRIGELLLKLAIRYAVERGIDELYLTHFTKENDALVYLISEYGFHKAGILKTTGENVFLKYLKAPPRALASMSPLEACKKYYPTFYDGSKVNKFIIPIRPEYEETLFIDEYQKGIQMKLHQKDPEFIVEGNTIKKIYLTQSQIKKINKGDIVIFYRSRSNQMLIAIGVVDSISLKLKDLNQIFKVISNRTVYRPDEVATMLGKGPITAITFLWITYFKKAVTDSDLKRIGAFKRPPMSVMAIHEDAYRKIKEMGGIDESYIIN